MQQYSAMAAGIALNADGSQLFAVNMENDSVSIVDTESRTVVDEIRLFLPGSSEAKGEYPMWVTPHAGQDGRTDKLYVTSVRDGQVIAISLPGKTQKVIPLGGEPTK
jgi:YVTN family beta-propeller protein